MALLARLALGLSVGVGVLQDGQVLRDFWLIPLRDGMGAWMWVWSFAGDEVEWRGMKFHLRKGKLCANVADPHHARIREPIDAQDTWLQGRLWSKS